MNAPARVAATVFAAAMAPQDLATLAQRPPCSFRLRREDAPAVAYGADGATIKVDGRIRGSDANADMVLEVRRAADERGYRGWARCASWARRGRRVRPRCAVA